MMAVKCEMSNMPMLEMVNVPPCKNMHTSIEVIWSNDKSIYLIFLRSEFTVSSLLCKRLSFGRYCCQPLVARVLDDRCDKTIVSSDGYRDVRLVISADFCKDIST